MIDWSRVDELRDEIGAEDFTEVVTLFLEETDEAIAALPGGTRLPEALHFLKGSATTLGFRRFAGLCQAGERATEVDLDALLHCYRASRAEFLARLPQIAGQIRNSASASSPVISR